MVTELMDRPTVEEADIGVGDLPASSTPGARFPEPLVACLLFFGTLAVYLVVMRARFDVYDCRAMLAVTENLVKHGTLVTTGVGFGDRFHQATPYSPYGIGMSLLGVPFYALSLHVGNLPVLVSLVNPLVTSATVVVIWRIGRALDWKAWHAATAALFYGVASMAVWYTTEGFSEPAVAFCLSLLVLGIIRWSKGSNLAPLWIGLAAGLAIQFRTDALVTVWIGLLTLPFFVPWRKLVGWRTWGLMLPPMALGVAGLVAYNEFRYHKAVVSSYGGRFDVPLRFGVRGLLASPDRSLFIFNPLAVLGVLGIVLLLIKVRPVGILFLLLIVTRVVFFARWSSWDGAWCWGPRFLLPVVPLFMLGAVEVIRSTRPAAFIGFLVRAVTAVLVAASLAVNALSVRVPVNQWFDVLYTPSRRLYYGLPSTGVGYSNWDWNNGVIGGYVTLLRHHNAQIAPYFWAEGHGGVCVALLVLAGVLLALALWGSSAKSVHRHARSRTTGE